MVRGESLEFMTKHIDATELFNLPTFYTLSEVMQETGLNAYYAKILVKPVATTDGGLLLYSWKDIEKAKHVVETDPKWQLIKTRADKKRLSNVLARMKDYRDD